MDEDQKSLPGSCKRDMADLQKNETATDDVDERISAADYELQFLSDWIDSIRNSCAVTLPQLTNRRELLQLRSPDRDDGLCNTVNSVIHLAGERMKNQADDLEDRQNQVSLELQKVNSLKERCGATRILQNHVDCVHTVRSEVLQLEEEKRRCVEGVLGAIAEQPDLQHIYYGSDNGDLLSVNLATLMGEIVDLRKKQLDEVDVDIERQEMEHQQGEAGVEAELLKVERLRNECFQLDRSRSGQVDQLQRQIVQEMFTEDDLSTELSRRYNSFLLDEAAVLKSDCQQKSEEIKQMIEDIAVEKIRLIKKSGDQS